jgi:ribosomal-protein-alanine N-acetyltransferase
MSLPCLETARFHLRPLGEDDDELYVALYTDADVMRHVGEPLTLRAASRAFNKVATFNRREDGGYRTWVVVDRATVKTCGLLALVAQQGASEIGALIWPQYHNDGIATEIIRRLMDFAFMECGLDVIFTRHLVANNGAEGLKRKLDFERIPTVGSRDGEVRWERIRQRWQHHG